MILPVTIVEGLCTIAWLKRDVFLNGLGIVYEREQKSILSRSCARKKEPLNCHRAILISKCLELLHFDVQHIHADGKIESQGAMINRLLRKLRLNENMFSSHEATVRDAYRIQGERIAYIGKSDHL